MKALVLAGVNQPLQLQEVPDPAPAPGEVIVAVEAAALNRRDLWIKKASTPG